MIQKAISILIIMLVILTPLSSIPVTAENSCTIQDQINYICSLGPDSKSSCTSEWNVYGQDLNDLIRLRESYGPDMQLSETAYKGSCNVQSVKTNTEGGNEPPCTIQDRINWICRQSEKDGPVDCSAEYGDPEFADELNKLVEYRKSYGQTKILTEIGYSQSECGTKRVPEITEKTESGKTTIIGQGIEVEIKNGMITRCKKDGVKAECPENADIAQILAESEKEEIVQNGAKISLFNVGDGKPDQLYTPYSQPKIEISSFGEKGSDFAIIIWLTDKNGEKIVPVKFFEGTFTLSEGDFTLGEAKFSTLVDDGEYNVLAELWQDGLKRDEKYFTAEGRKGSLFILENADEAVIVGQNEDELAEKFYAYLDARYKYSKDSNEYMHAFKEFMKAYIISTFENEHERDAAISALDEQDLSSLIRETELSFRKQIQEYYLDASLASMNAAYDETKGAYDSSRSADWTDLFNFGKVFINMGSVLLQQSTFNPNLATLTKNPQQIEELRSSLMIARKYVRGGGDYNELYDRLMRNGALNPEEELLSKTMKDYKFKMLFESIKDSNSAGVHYSIGKIFTHYAIFAFIDIDSLLDNAVEPSGQKMGKEKAIEAFNAMTEDQEEALYQVSGDLTLQRSSGQLRNLIQLGQDQFSIVQRVYPDPAYLQKIERDNRNIKAWGQRAGFVGGLITFSEIAQGAGMMLIGGIGMGAVISKIPSIASKVTSTTQLTRTIMFSGAAISGAQTIGGCIDYFSTESVSQSGTEWEKCYVPAATTIALTAAPMKLSPKALKPVLKSEETRAVIVKSIKVPKPISASPKKMSKLPKTPSLESTPEATAAAAADEAAETAEKIVASPQLSAAHKNNAVDKLKAFAKSKKVEQKSKDKAKQAQESIEKSREKIKPSTSGKIKAESKPLAYRIDYYDFKGRIITYSNDMEIYALSDPHGNMFKVIKGLEDAKLVSPKTRQSVINKYAGDNNFRMSDADIDGIANEVSRNLKNKGFVILGDVIDVETSGMIDHGDDIIKLVISLEKKTDYRVTSIMGNHEAARFGHLKMGKGNIMYDTTDIDSNPLRKEFISSRPIAAVQGNKVFIHSAASGFKPDVITGSRSFSGEEFYYSFYGREYSSTASDDLFNALGVGKDAIFIEGHTPGRYVGITNYGWKGNEFIITPEYAGVISASALPK